MARDQGVETQMVAFTATNQEATFEGGIKGCYLVATADCYVDFDQPTDTGSLLIKANLAPVFLEFKGSIINKVHVMRVSGNGNLHILGIR